MFFAVNKTPCFLLNGIIGLKPLKNGNDLTIILQANEEAFINGCTIHY